MGGPNVSAVQPLLVNGNIPTRPSDFQAWFDQLSLEELNLLWNSRAKIGKSTVRVVIERRIRAPGELHEWLMTSRAPKFKELGISMVDIQNYRTLTERTIFKRPSNLPSYVAPGGIPIGRHGGRGANASLSKRFHDELLALIDASTSYTDYRLRMRRFAERWLPNGVDDLPAGLLIR